MRGVMLAMLALMLFACLDTTTKYLTQFFNVPVIVACRYIANVLLMAAVLGPTRPKALVQTNRTWLVILRGLFLASASLLVGLALQRIPVAETTAIAFSAPMVVVLAARPLLGERIGRLGWIAVIMGFGGVLLIARPGNGLADTGVIFALLAVIAHTGYQLLSRLLAMTEKTEALMFYTAVVGAVLYGMALPFFWEGRWPDLWEALLLVSLGVSGGLGHFIFTAAYRYAPASILAPVTYMQLIWAGLLGWIVFGDMPDAITFLGMAIVCASGVLIALKTTGGRRRRKA